MAGTGILRPPKITRETGETELDFRGVYRIAPEGGLTLLADDFEQPNGLCFSLDERRLFVNDTDRQHIRVFDVRTDGTLENSRVWAETTGEGSGAPDGMKIDSEGNLFSCGPGGIHVFDPDANCLGVINVPEIHGELLLGGTTCAACSSPPRPPSTGSN